MNSLGKIKQLLLVMALMASSGGAFAGWELDNGKSTVNFVSIKNDSVGEVHSFTSLVGFIGDDGEAQLTISLESVETLIDVRNERMREMLFETIQFPTANILAQVDPGLLAVAAEGGVVTTELSVTLSLHGKKKPMTVPVVIVGEGDGYLRIFSAQPILINAADFDLAAGVAALQKVAGLDAISNAVPVTLQLFFVPAS